MRALLRTEVDVTKSPDLSELGAFESVVTSIRAKYYESDLNQKHLKKEATKRLSERMKTIDELKRVIIARINKRLKNDNSGYKSMTLLIDRSSEDFIEDTLNSSDFSAYNIEIIEENSDYLTSFPDLPIKVEISRRC